VTKPKNKPGQTRTNAYADVGQISYTQDALPGIVSGVGAIHQELPDNNKEVS
jgi:hypothetical protein